MNATHTLRYRQNSTAILRRSLGLTQQQLADYLNVLPQRVGDAESGRRALTMRGNAGIRHTYLLLLLPPAAFDAANMPERILEPPVAGELLPIPAPVPPLTEKAREDLAWRQKVCAVEAKQLRFALAQRLARAQWQTHIRHMRQAVLAAFANPPANAVALRAQVPDDDPATTADFQQLLAILLRRSARVEGLLAPATLAHDQLRLYLLEAEAVTLAAWLAASETAPIT